MVIDMNGLIQMRLRAANECLRTSTELDIISHIARFLNAFEYIDNDHTVVDSTFGKLVPFFSIDGHKESA